MILYILFALVVQLYLFLELTSYSEIYCVTCVSMQWNFNMKYIVSDKLQKLGFYYIDEVNRLID